MRGTYIVGLLMPSVHQMGYACPLSADMISIPNSISQIFGTIC